MLYLAIPGVPDWASYSAFFRVGTMSRIFVTEAQYLHNGLNRDIWSISCRAPLPCKKRKFYINVMYNNVQFTKKYLMRQHPFLILNFKWSLFFFKFTYFNVEIMWNKYELFSSLMIPTFEYDVTKLVTLNFFFNNRQKCLLCMPFFSKQKWWVASVDQNYFCILLTLW